MNVFALLDKIQKNKDHTSNWSVQSSPSETGGTLWGGRAHSLDQKANNPEKTSTLLSFKARLPKKPYCTNNPKSGLLIRKKETALRYDLLQINSPKEIHTLVFDVDTEFGGFAWESAGLPPPSLSAINPENGHAHLFYFLKTPVVRSKRGRSKPLQYLKAIESAFRNAMGADSGYVGLVAKNPFSDHWTKGPFDTFKSHELGELAEYVDLTKKTPVISKGDSPDVFYGRNTALFNELRKQSYKLITKEQGLTAGEFKTLVAQKAEEINSRFEKPLSLSEVKATVKSVSDWVWSRKEKVRTFFKVCEKTAFSEIQRQRAFRSAAVRRRKAEAKMEEVAVLRKQGKSINAISKETGYPYESVRRWCVKIDEKGRKNNEKPSKNQVPEKANLMVANSMNGIACLHESELTKSPIPATKTFSIFQRSVTVPFMATPNNSGVFTSGKISLSDLFGEKYFNEGASLEIVNDTNAKVPGINLILAISLRDTPVPFFNLRYYQEEIFNKNQSDCLNGKFCCWPLEYASFFLRCYQKEFLESPSRLIWQYGAMLLVQSLSWNVKEEASFCLAAGRLPSSIHELSNVRDYDHARH